MATHGSVTARASVSKLIEMSHYASKLILNLRWPAALLRDWGSNELHTEHASCTHQAEDWQALNQEKFLGVGGSHLETSCCKAGD